MMAKINPFRPNSPVNFGMFVGRLDEVETVEQTLLQTRAGRPSNFLITGERGIGKTSLLWYLAAVARGQIPLDDDVFNFLVVEVDIDVGTTPLGLVKKIELGLRRELGKSDKARERLKSLWDFLQRVEAAGVRLKDSETVEEEVMLDEFAYSVARTANRICGDSQDDSLAASHDGVLILIDEADNASPELQLGSFLKLLLERVQRHRCNHLMVGLAGLDEVRDVLRSSHESALRLFEEIRLNRLTGEYVEMVILMALKEAMRQNATPTSITTKGKSLLVGLSEGYPHFIQQFGYSAFSVDTDDEIDEDDIREGALGTGGALELIGNRYYRNDFYNKIQKDSYRQVLRIMAGKLDAWVSKAEIRKEFKGKETTLSNAIYALRDRHIILSKEGERGVYRLQQKGFALWIRIYASIKDRERI